MLAKLSIRGILEREPREKKALNPEKRRLLGRHEPLDSEQTTDGNEQSRGPEPEDEPTGTGAAH